jgi:hypothetical protein
MAKNGELQERVYEFPAGWRLFRITQGGVVFFHLNELHPRWTQELNISTRNRKVEESMSEAQARFFCYTRPVLGKAA